MNKHSPVRSKSTRSLFLIENDRNKIFHIIKTMKKSKLHIDKDICNAARCKVKKMIYNKMWKFGLWKVLKYLGWSNKIFSCKISALKVNNTVEYDASSASEGFKNYRSTLAESLVKMIPRAPINTLLTLLLNVMNT